MLWIDSNLDEFWEKFIQIPDIYKKNVLELREWGYTVINNANNTLACDNFIKDFENYTDFKNMSPKYYNDKRWIGGHTLSESTKNLACNEKVLKLLDCIFEWETIVYSSLIFWKGAEQGVHRDTPHFYTNPEDYYFGCLYALEDMHDDSGSFFYYEGGHKLTIPSGEDIYSKVLNNMDSDSNELMDSENINYKCLVEYCDREIVNACENFNSNLDKYKTVKIKKGDCIVWHPKLPYGTSKITNLHRFRKSCITYCVPIYKGVTPSNTYFNDTYKDSQDYELQFYNKNIEYNIAPNGRKYMSCGHLEGKPIVQTSYT